MVSTSFLAELDIEWIMIIVLGILVILGLILLVAWAVVTVLTREEEREKLAAAQEEQQRQMEALESESHRLTEEAERQRLLAEQSAQDKQIVLANAQRDIRKHQLLSVSADPSGNLEVLVNERLLHQAKQGRVIHAHFVAVRTGRLVIQWAVECDGPVVPLVAGFRDGKKIFSEYSFAGEHPDQIKRGKRYVYSFRVERDGKMIEKEDEFLFEVIIPTPAQWNRKTGAALPRSTEDPSTRQKRLIAEKGRSITERMEAMGQALRQAEEQLRKQRLDEDTIQRTLARLESQLSSELER